MGQLDDAAKAHQEAIAGLTATKERARADILAARKRIEVTRVALAEAIAAEAMTGTPQKDIILRTGYSRERVRTILRSHGIEPV